LSSLRHTVERDGYKRSVSATIGGAFLEANVDDPHDALRRADIALYAAKRASKGSGKICGEEQLLTAA
jgi:predicted signal transduction protein with EAL and GGDEF domain